MPPRAAVRAAPGARWSRRPARQPARKRGRNEQWTWRILHGKTSRTTRQPAVTCTARRSALARLAHRLPPGRVETADFVDQVTIPGALHPGDAPLQLASSEEH